jgi:hypothetical protein
MVKVALAAFVVVAALVALPAASAKDFKPGDVRICNSDHCRAVVNNKVLALLAAFYYRRRSPPARVARPQFGQPYYELRYRNGYVTGIVATQRLDRFLSYGVFLGRFTRYRWYEIPAAASREFRRLAVGLRPMRLSSAAIAKSH